MLGYNGKIYNSHNAMNVNGLGRKSGLPLKKQAEIYLRKLIGEKKYQDGELLPDEVSLASRLGISRHTIRAAIGILVYEGLLERKAGIGTRVKKMNSESAILSWRSLSREMSKKGITVQTFDINIEMIKASDIAAKALQVAPSTPLYRLDRIRGWNDMPILRSRSWFHPRLKLTGDEDFSQPLYDVIKNVSGLYANRADEEFLAVSADKELSVLLHVKTGSPLLLRRHIVFDKSNRPMELAEIHYVSDRFSLTLALKHGE
ncbi:MAG: GntR family transcriptional regulator [Planctomycetaceae bacterium]|nr:GntR family transcriptional regulator [Planctomycetaceae bacterium]